jgi:hypothetical protein
VATGAGIKIRLRARRLRLSLDQNRRTKFRNAQLMFPDPRRLPLTILNPSADRNQTARSSAYKVRATRELTAIVASKACRRSPVQHQFRGQHHLSAAGAAMAIIQVSKGVDFLFP